MTDTTTEYSSSTDPQTLEIVLSSRGAILSGVVRDDRGEPVRARVLIVPMDRVRWNIVDQGRWSALSSAGNFRLAAQRPGEYAVVAVSPTEPLPAAEDLAFFERIVKAGQHITLTENDRRSIDLRLMKLEVER